MRLLRRFLGPRVGKETKPAPSPLFSAQEQQEAGQAPLPPLKTRPLEPPKPFTTTSRRIRVGIASDVGQARTSNQDAALVFMASAEMAGNPPPVGFMVVADGMGGHHDGELASALAVQTLARYIINEIIIPHLDGREYSAEQRTIPEVLADSMHAANRAVQEHVPDGGTTATCAVIRGDLAYIAHVGDSRAYLISEGSIELVTRDHSLVRRLQELGQLTAEEAEVYPHRNVLYRAIGQGESLEVDAATRRLPPSSSLLLCSDGLWSTVSERKILEVLREHPDPQDACDQLVAAANAKGGPDNITVVLMQMPD